MERLCVRDLEGNSVYRVAVLANQLDQIPPHAITANVLRAEPPLLEEIIINGQLEHLPPQFRTRVFLFPNDPIVECRLFFLVLAMGQLDALAVDEYVADYPAIRNEWSPDVNLFVRDICACVTGHAWDYHCRRSEEWLQALATLYLKLKRR